MATAKELVSYIGRCGSIHLGKVVVNVRVTDARVSWGAVQVEIEPLSGSGSQWVDVSGVTFFIGREAYGIVGPDYNFNIEQIS